MCGISDTEPAVVVGPIVVWCDVAAIVLMYAVSTVAVVRVVVSGADVLAAVLNTAMLRA